MITLKTLHEATEQEVFDQVARHLLTQNEKSMDEKGNRCRYRGINNLRCAAGCLIDDDEYRHAMEDQYWRQLSNDGFAPLDHVSLIQKLQNIHDDSDVDSWIDDLESLAKERNLNTSVLDEFK